jgi:CspA family cold shock protein
MMTGTIKTLRIDKGFGFIMGQDGLQYFMHRSAIRGGEIFEQLREGQLVAFDPTTSDKGPRAENVRVDG